MIRSVLDFVFSEADIGRDSSRGSSTAKKRPDFCFMLNEVCVFRGEEKEPGMDIIKLLRSELEEKLIWSYGKVPYLFSYAASGFKIRLFVLIRGINDATDATTFQLGLFNLEDVTHRFRMVLALLNLCLLFPAITEECPYSGRNEYSNIHLSIETSHRPWDDFARRTAFTKRLLQQNPTRRPTAEEDLCDLAKLEKEATQEQVIIENLGKTQIQRRKRKQEQASK